MDKKITAYDKIEQREDAKIQKTRIIIRDPITGEIIHEGTNKVLIAGSTFTAMKHFNINAPVMTPTYNTALNLQNSVTEAYGSAGLRREEECLLFCIGTDGCGAEQHQVYPVNYKKWTDPAALVPFRYPLTSNDLSAGLRTSYYGRKVISDRAAYYFKKFETAPQLKLQFIDGTPIDANIYNSSKPEEVEAYVELLLKVTKDDCRDFFTNTTGINTAKINTISLCTAWPKDYTGTIYYQDIRPMTKINLPNEPLIDLSKGLDITYQIFY